MARTLNCRVGKPWEEWYQVRTKQDTQLGVLKDGLHVLHQESTQELEKV